jgi:hypothetical protein
MKILKYVYLAVLGLALVLTSCHDESMVPASITTPNQQTLAIGDEITNGGENTLPIVTVIKNNFSQTTGWRITWSGGVITPETAQKIQSIFSTITGAVNSVKYLNATSPANTDNADMQLFFGKLRATSEISQLSNVGSLKQTKFRLSTWNVATLEDAAKSNPLNFTAGYEFGFFGPKMLETGAYIGGQIYLFKTDRPTPKYGAVRIVQYGGAESIIEVVVQK